MADGCKFTLHCALENGADLYVNERKIRHYRAIYAEERRRRKEEECQIAIFTSRDAYVKCAVIALIPLEISHRTRWWCLKCVIVYIARDIPTFVI